MRKRVTLQSACPAALHNISRTLACTKALVVNQYFWRILRLGVLVRGSVAAAVCRRTLRYRLRDSVDGGLISNLLSSDCGRLNVRCHVLVTY